jgi:hypothetical protein
MNTFNTDDTAMLRRYAAEHSLSLRWGETDQGDQWAILGQDHPVTITRERGRYTAIDEDGTGLVSADTLSAALGVIE